MQATLFGQSIPTARAHSCDQVHFLEFELFWSDQTEKTLESNPGSNWIYYGNRNPRASPWPFQMACSGNWSQDLDSLVKLIADWIALHRKRKVGWSLDLIAEDDADLGNVKDLASCLVGEMSERRRKGEKRNQWSLHFQLFGWYLPALIDLRYLLLESWLTSKSHWLGLVLGQGQMPKSTSFVWTQTKKGIPPQRFEIELLIRAATSWRLRISICEFESADANCIPGNLLVIGLNLLWTGILRKTWSFGKSRNYVHFIQNGPWFLCFGPIQCGASFRKPWSIPGKARYSIE